MPDAELTDAASLSITEPAPTPSEGRGPHRFGKGNPGAGLRQAAAERRAAAERAGASPPVPALLRAMRFVTANHEGKDRNQLQKECRALLKEDRKGFITTLASLEKAFAAAAEQRGAKEEGPAPDAQLTDAGNDKVEDLILGMLDEATAFLDLEPADRRVLIERGLVGSDGEARWKLTAKGRSALGLPPAGR